MNALLHVQPVEVHNSLTTIQGQVSSVHNSVSNVAQLLHEEANTFAPEGSSLDVFAGLLFEKGMWTILARDLTLFEVIGTGSFGNVYRGRWAYIDGDVAVKELKADAVSKLKQFQKEVSMMMNLSHPRVVQLYGLCTMPRYMVFELCHQGSLFDVLQKTPTPPGFTWTTRLKVAYQIAQGMAFLHSRNILHRDLKSPNVLLTKEWDAKIADFGYARRCAADVASSSSKAANPIWMDPDLLRNPDKPCDKSTDVYSFGIILYELLLMELPAQEMLSQRMGQMRLYVELVYRGVDIRRCFDLSHHRLPGGHMTPVTHGYLQMLWDCLDPDASRRPTFRSLAPALRRMEGAQTDSDSSVASCDTNRAESSGAGCTSLHLQPSVTSVPQCTAVPHTNPPQLPVATHHTLATAPAPLLNAALQNGHDCPQGSRMNGHKLQYLGLHALEGPADVLQQYHVSLDHPHGSHMEGTPKYLGLHALEGPADVLQQYHVSMDQPQGSRISGAAQPDAGKQDPDASWDVEMASVGSGASDMDAEDMESPASPDCATTTTLGNPMDAEVVVVEYNGLESSRLGLPPSPAMPHNASPFTSSSSLVSAFASPFFPRAPMGLPAHFPAMPSSGAPLQLTMPQLRATSVFSFATSISCASPSPVASPSFQMAAPSGTRNGSTRITPVLPNAPAPRLRHNATFPLESSSLSATSSSAATLPRPRSTSSVASNVTQNVPPRSRSSRSAAFQRMSKRLVALLPMTRLPPATHNAPSGSHASPATTQNTMRTNAGAREEQRSGSAAGTAVAAVDEESVSLRRRQSNPAPPDVRPIQLVKSILGVMPISSAAKPLAAADHAMWLGARDSVVASRTAQGVACATRAKPGSRDALVANSHDRFGSSATAAGDGSGVSSLGSHRSAALLTLGSRTVHASTRLPSVVQSRTRMVTGQHKVDGQGVLVSSHRVEEDAGDGTEAGLLGDVDGLMAMLQMMKLAAACGAVQGRWNSCAMEAYCCFTLNVRRPIVHAGNEMWPALTSRDRQMLEADYALQVACVRCVTGQALACRLCQVWGCTSDVGMVRDVCHACHVDHKAGLSTQEYCLLAVTLHYVVKRRRDVPAYMDGRQSMRLLGH